MKPINAKRERGAALLALLAVIMLGASWLLVSKLNTESGAAQAAYKVRNAEVLLRAKRALIGYVAAQAAIAGENNPGAMPCPEAAGYFDSTTQDGTVASSCTLPKVGRFPWRTLGTEKFVDAAGEPLWYVVSPGWARTSGNTNINSHTVGQLTVDGVANDAVALIIAPGPAFNVAASSGCAAKSQTRSTTGTPDWRNYLECENATYPTPDATFVTTGPSASFNDQVMRVTVADVMPAIEAGIADRIAREILPALKAVYTPATWGFTGSSPVTANPVLPFAAPFANPGSGTGTSDYRGVSGTYAGLLPFNQTQGCTESTSDPRCTTATTGGTAFLVFSKSGTDTAISGSGSVRTSSTCTWVSTVYVCTGEYLAPSIAVMASVTVTNVAMGLRAIDPSKITCTAVDDVGNGIPVQNVACSSSVVLQPDGSAIITVSTVALPDISSSGWGTYANYKINIDRAAIGDHALLSSTDSTTGWFVRNEWYRLVYYTVAASNTALRLPAERSCTSAGDCPTVTAGTGTTSTSALLVLAGRSINGRARPSSTLADYFEFGNAKGSFERQSVTAVASTMYVDTGTANAYSVPVSSLATGVTLQFRAANANTGTSTLNSAATGTRPLVNADGTNLSASTILANAAVQVSWDGTKFILAKRPFNDRIIASTHN
jgi:hypothetical protein